MNVALLRADYKTASFDELEKLFISRENIPTFLALIEKDTPVNEIVILSTCNRVEIYFLANDTELAASWLKSELMAFNQLTPNDIEVMRLVNSTEDTIRHLYNVSSGIESMVFGETEILGQVKIAYDLAFQNNATGPILNKIFQSAVATGKRVRTDTEISKGGYSVSSLAIDEIENHFRDLSDKRILIVGAGTMAMRALKKLSAMGVKHLKMSNRTEDKLSRIHEKYGVEIIPYESFQSELQVIDVVIAATASKSYIISNEHLERCNGRPSMLVDLGIPRNINPGIDVSDRHLLSLVGLQKLADKTIENRMGEMSKINAIIDDEYDRLHKWYDYKVNV